VLSRALVSISVQANKNNKINCQFLLQSIIWSCELCSSYLFDEFRKKISEQDKDVKGQEGDHVLEPVVRDEELVRGATHAQLIHRKDGQHAEKVEPNAKQQEPCLKMTKKKNFFSRM
jgi:hypothetical protein